RLAASYAQWFFWARTERGLDEEQSHAVASQVVTGELEPASAPAAAVRAPVELPLRASDVAGGAAVLAGVLVALAASPQPVAWAGPLAGVAVFLVLVGGVVIVGGRQAAAGGHGA